VCQKLGIVLQEGDTGNGLDKAVMVMLSFAEKVVALYVMLDHAAQLFQAGDELVAKVILERRLGACFEPGTPAAAIPISWLDSWGISGPSSV
jgi:hypothetical protein